MYSWKLMTVALCLVTGAQPVFAEPPGREHNAAAIKKRHQKTAEPANDGVCAYQAAEANQEAEKLLIGALDDGSKQPEPKKADSQPTAAGDKPSERGELAAAQGGLNTAANRLEATATVRERAEQARERAWSRWKAKLKSHDAIDPRIRRELEKHARREAKLQRLGSLAKQAGDAQALDRLAKLQTLEAALHEKQMQTLTVQPEKERAQP
jgi:hypothetical protein